MRHFPCTIFPLLQNEFIKHCLNAASCYRPHDTHSEEPQQRTDLGDPLWVLRHRTYFIRSDGAHLHTNVQQLEGALTNLVVSNNHLYRPHLRRAKESKTCLMGAEPLILPPEAPVW